MEKPKRREMKVFLLLSIVVPVGLLTTLRMTGIWHGSILISETTTLKTISWQYEIPSHSEYVLFNQSLSSQHSSSELSATFDLNMGEYQPSIPPVRPYSTVDMLAQINATGGVGVSVESIKVVFSDVRSTSVVVWNPSSEDFFLHNLSLTERQDGYLNQSALLRLAGVNSPSNVYFRDLVYWSSAGMNPGVQQLQASFELIYYNGTAYNRLIQPFTLTLIGG